MHAHSQPALAFAEIAADSASMNEAALAGDWEEARFLAVLVASKAEAARMADVALAADDIIVILAALGSQPNSDVGAAMLKLAEALDRVRITPL